jgi:hypothetical protein
MAWKKGQGIYPKNWDKIKAIVLDRANYRCEIYNKLPDNYGKNYQPFAWDNITSKRFVVHHKDADKSNNDLINLIYLC